MHDESSSLSLWDTFTCAILVTIVLLAVSLIQLVAEKRALEADGIPADIADRLEGASSSLVSAEQALKEHSAALGGRADSGQEVRDLESRLQVLAGEPARVEALMSRLAEARGEETADEAALQRVAAAVADLRGEIDRRGSAPVPVAATLALPVRRVIQQDLTPVGFVCRFGRVYPLDRDALGEAFRRALGEIQRQFTPTVPLVQRLNMLRTSFAETDIGNAHFRLRLRNVIDGRQFVGFSLVTEPRPDGGELSDDALKDGSHFLNMVRGIDPSRQSISFFVWSDSFDSYIALRRRVEDLFAQDGSKATQIGLSWMPYAEDQSLQEFLDVLGRNRGSGSGPARGTVIDNP